MKRTPLKRKTRLKVKGKSRFPKRRNDAYRKWIRTLECVVFTHVDWWTTLHGKVDDWCLRTYGATDCAHIKTQGSGGVDLGNCVPLCRKHHREQEGRTARFNEKYALDLGAIAADLLHRWREQQGEPAA